MHKYTYRIGDGRVLQYACGSVSMEALLAHVQRFARVIKFPAKRPADVERIARRAQLVKDIVYVVYICPHTTGWKIRSIAHKL